MRLRGLGILAMLLAVLAVGCRGTTPYWPAWNIPMYWAGWCPKGICWTRPCIHPYFRWIDEYKARHLARCAAHRELRCLDNCGGLSCDYRAGFEQAFVDVALGADGSVPVFPPREYWKDKNRTPIGHQKVQEWFQGYAAGAEQALACRAEFNFVPSSWGVTNGG